MIIKPFRAKDIISIKQSFFLLYGENEGYKNQIIDNILKKFGENNIKYDADDIINNPDIIFSELNNFSIFLPIIFFLTLFHYSPVNSCTNFILGFCLYSGYISWLNERNININHC